MPVKRGCVRASCVRMRVCTYVVSANVRVCVCACVVSANEWDSVSIRRAHIRARARFLAPVTNPPRIILKFDEESTLFAQMHACAGEKAFLTTQFFARFSVLQK